MNHEMQNKASISGKSGSLIFVRLTSLKPMEGSINEKKINEVDGAVEASVIKLN